jgi:PHD/YefM family antitoxin component YafN of YafNO toxin-antitoxin module
MKTLSVTGQDIKVRELIEASHKEPVTVLAEGKRAMIVLSPAEFDRLEAQDRIRREAKERLRRTIAAIQRKAAERGLTEAELDRQNSIDFLPMKASNNRVGHDQDSGANYRIVQIA